MPVSEHASVIGFQCKCSVRTQPVSHLIEGAGFRADPRLEALPPHHHNAWRECVRPIRDRTLSVAVHGKHSLHEGPQRTLLKQCLVAQEPSRVEKELNCYLQSAAESAQL